MGINLIIFSAIQKKRLNSNWFWRQCAIRNSNREHNGAKKTVQNSTRYALDGSFSGTIRARFNKSNMPTQRWHVLDRLSLQVHTSPMQGIARELSICSWMHQSDDRTRARLYLQSWNKKMRDVIAREKEIESFSAPRFNGKILLRSLNFFLLH